MDLWKEKASEEPVKKKSKLDDCLDSIETNRNKLVPESIQSHLSSGKQSGNEVEEDVRTISSWSSCDRKDENADRSDRELSPISSWASANSPGQEIRTISDWSSDDENYEPGNDPFPLMEIPFHLRDDILCKLDFHSKIEMKCSESGMDEYMNKFITVHELLDHWDWMVDVFEELKSDGMGEWPPRFDELRDWKMMMYDMKDYVAQKHPDLELKDWDSETTISWEDWMEYQFENNVDQFLHPYDDYY